MMGGQQQPTVQEIAAAAQQFMLRANLSGSEVASFNIVMTWLDGLARGETAHDDD